MGTWPFPEWIENVSAATRLASALPGFLRHRLTLEASAAAQRHRRETRDAAWLALVRAAVYGNLRSPYLRLLQRAGCEPGDLEDLVRRNGLEGALHHLYRAGVYLTIEEFKGRRPVVRGSDQFSVYPNLLVLFLGCFIEGAALLLVLPPILVPALARIGVDPVHFGIVLIVGVGIGLFTPPVGMGLYAMQGFTKTSFGEVVAAVFPWLLPLVGALLVVTYVPWIALALPRALGY